MRYPNRAMHDRRAASRVEQWLEATRWSDALSLQCRAPSDETLAARSDAPALLFSSACWRAVMLARVSQPSEPLHLDCSSAKELSLLVSYFR